MKRLGTLSESYPLTIDCKNIFSRHRGKLCENFELFWSAFSRIRTEYGEILCISPCLVRMWENADQNNSKYGQCLCSGRFQYFEMIPVKLSNSKVYPGLKNTSNKLQNLHKLLKK